MGYSNSQIKKKWELSEQRRSQFQKNGVYTICCYVDDCSCAAKSDICPRGFFSLFLQVLYGIELAQRNQLAFQVDFGNHLYLYTDASRADRNFWNYFFVQDGLSKPDNENIVRNLFHEVYPLRVWRRKHFLRLHKALEELTFREEIANKLQAKKEFFSKHNVLGVQIRRTDHAQEIEPVPLASFLEEIDKRIRYFDYLFVATDDSQIIDLLRNKYGNRLLTNKVQRSNNGIAVHVNPEFENRYQLAEEAIIDCYCLSLCKYAILVQSNISYSAVVFNPELNYKLMEVSGFWIKAKRNIQNWIDGVQRVISS